MLLPFSTEGIFENGHEETPFLEHPQHLILCKAASKIKKAGVVFEEL